MSATTLHAPDVGEAIGLAALVLLFAMALGMGLGIPFAGATTAQAPLADAGAD